MFFENKPSIMRRNEDSLPGGRILIVCCADIMLSSNSEASLCRQRDFTIPNCAASFVHSSSDQKPSARCLSVLAIKHDRGQPQLHSVILSNNSNDR